MLAPWKKSSDKPRRRIKKQRHLFADQGPYSQSYGFPSSHIGIWELDHKELMLYEALMKTWCFQIVVLEKTLENPLDSREIKLVHPKGYQPWIFIGRTDAEAEAPVLWLLDEKCGLIGKDPDAGKDWRQEARGWQWMRWLDDYHGFNMSLSWCRGHKESNMNEQLNQHYHHGRCIFNFMRECLATF